LAAAAIAESLKVIPIPGASAPLAALALAGLPSDRFLFAGFAPNRSGQRRKWLAEIAETQATLILFENAKRLASSLNDMAVVLGDRQACVTRELTKLFEEARRGTLSELAAHYAESGPPKGEITLVIGPPKPVELDETVLDDLLEDLLNTLSVKDAATQAAERTGSPRKQAYQRALAIKQEKA
jgi:16S rRNA (cytidine1402-2'-O)-methyltransferase